MRILEIIVDNDPNLAIEVTVRILLETVSIIQVIILLICRVTSYLRAKRL